MDASTISDPTIDADTIDSLIFILKYLDETMGDRCLRTAAQYGGTLFDAREDLRRWLTHPAADGEAAPLMVARAQIKVRAHKTLAAKG